MKLKLKFPQITERSSIPTKPILQGMLNKSSEEFLKLKQKGQTAIQSQIKPLNSV